MNDSLEMKVYEKMCANCEYERKCHVQCETCEKYNDALTMLAAEEYDKNRHRLESKLIIKDGEQYYCPSCKRLIGNYPFCKYCGQKLEVK